MTREQKRLEQLRRWKQAFSWAPVFWFPLLVYALAIGAPATALSLGLAGASFAGAARLAVWSARCPRCSESFRRRPGGFRRVWDESACSACGVSLFDLRRARSNDPA